MQQFADRGRHSCMWPISKCSLSNICSPFISPFPRERPETSRVAWWFPSTSLGKKYVNTCIHIYLV